MKSMGKPVQFTRCHIVTLEKYYMELVNEYATASFGPALAHATQILQPEIVNITRTLTLALNEQATKNLIDACYQLSIYIAHLQIFYRTSLCGD
jgi:hypothetical protein